MLLTLLAAAQSRPHLQLPSPPALGGPRGDSRAPISALKTSQRAVSRENLQDFSCQGIRARRTQLLSCWYARSGVNGRRLTLQLAGSSECRPTDLHWIYRLARHNMQCSAVYCTSSGACPVALDNIVITRHLGG